MKERRREEGKRQEEEWEGERSLEGHCNQGNSGKAGGPTGSLGPPLRSLTSQSKGRDARRARLLLASHPQGSSTRPGGGRKAGRLQLPWRWGYGEASEGERGEEEIEARWGVGGKWEPMWEEPTDPRCLGPFPDHPGPLGPSKSPPPQPQATTVSNTHPPQSLLPHPPHPATISQGVNLRGISFARFSHICIQEVPCQKRSLLALAAPTCHLPGTPSPHPAASIPLDSPILWSWSREGRAGSATPPCTPEPEDPSLPREGRNPSLAARKARCAERSLRSQKLLLSS